MIGEREFAFPQKGTVSKLESMETGSSFETRNGHASFDLIEAAAAHERMELVEADHGDTTMAPRIATLSTIGLAKALEPLQKDCGQKPHDKFFDAPAIPYLDLQGVSSKR